MENNIQQSIVTYFNNTYCLKHHNPRSIIFSVPNGSNRSMQEAIMLKATGLLSGVSDLILIHNGRVVFIEVKQPTKKQQPSQIDFQNRVSNLGFEYQIIRSLEEFKNFITNNQ